MKTFLINSIRQISVKDKKSDLTSTMMSNEWVVFTGNPKEIEKFLFLKKEELLISKNGKSFSSRWRFITVSSSIVIEDGNETYLFKIASCDKNLIVLNLDSTQQYCFLINSQSQQLENCTFSDIQWYLIRNCNLDLLTDQQREEYNKVILLHKQRQEEFNEEYNEETLLHKQRQEELEAKQKELEAKQKELEAQQEEKEDKLFRNFIIIMVILSVTYVLFTVLAT